MDRWLQALIIGAATIATGVSGYLLTLAVAPNQTVCHGSPTDGYCDTHAWHWAIAGLLAGLIIGGGVGLAVLCRTRKSPAD
jgi:hypothetical protein